MSDLIWTPVRIRLGQIRPWTDNPRMSTKAQAERLIQSEQELGQIQTLAVSPFDGGIIRKDSSKNIPALLLTVGNVTKATRCFDMNSITKICVKCGTKKSILSFPFQKNKCKQCYKEEHTLKHNKEYICENCGNVFISDHESLTRKPKFCSRTCAGFKSGETSWNSGNRVQYETCKVCGKQKTGKREKDFEICQTCSNKQRAVNIVYYACPRCGKPKNGRGRSDRIFCNSCAAIYKHQKLGHIIKPYYIGFTSALKISVRNYYNNACAICSKVELSLAVHHIDYNKNNQTFGNLLPLCSSCHGKTNRNRDYWKGVCQEIVRLWNDQ